LNAEAPAFTDLNTLLRRAPAAAQAEHISLESEPEPLPTPVRRRAVCASFQLTTALRDCVTLVSILQDHFVAVRTERSRGESVDYVLDLRFANPKPLRKLHIAWNWLSIALALATLSGLSMWLAPRPLPLLLVSPAFGIGLALVLAMLGALLKFARGTTESLRFLSEHGAVVVIDIAGGLGSTRRGRRFFVELIRNIRAAKQARPQPRPQRLRDEMREHHRLRELHVLSAADYEASKARILKAHA
jgi:hypothetical protein